MFTPAFLSELADAVASRVIAQLVQKNATQVKREYLSYDEVGQMIGRTKEGVRYLVKTGKLPICDEFGRVPRVHVDDVRAYMDGTKHWVT